MADLATGRRRSPHNPTQALHPFCSPHPRNRTPTPRALDVSCAPLRGLLAPAPLLPVRWRILTGHEHAVSALAFVKTGEHVASVSAEERTIRWWLAGSQGIFGFLGLQGSCLHTTAVEQPLVSDGSVSYEIEWTSPSAVKLNCNKRLVGTYSRPA